MILVDTSVWIYYYRPAGSKKIQEILKEAIINDLVAVNGIIMVEVLSGISRRVDFEEVNSDFNGFHIYPLDNKIFAMASSIGASLRRKGITIPSTDLIIAASAIDNNSTLYHIDNHFTLMAEHTKLKVENMEQFI